MRDAFGMALMKRDERITPLQAGRWLLMIRGARKPTFRYLPEMAERRSSLGLGSGVLPEAASISGEWIICIRV